MGGMFSTRQHCLSQNGLTVCCSSSFVCTACCAELAASTVAHLALHMPLFTCLHIVH